MKILTDRTIVNHVTALIIAVASLFGMSSCSAVYDDLEECPRGVIMRFIFDYNLEFANAFPKQVDCLTVYIFDTEGNLVERRTETSGVLADEDWRMKFDLPAGNYRAVVYGGMECEQSSFAHTRDVAEISRIDHLEVLANETHIGDPSNPPQAPLHDHFYGAVDFTVNEATDYDKTTVEMMRNTNHLRLVLQHIDNTPVNHEDFDFEVIDDNTLFDSNNDIVPRQAVTYTPWARGNAEAGVYGLPADDGDDEASRDGEGMPVQVAYAEISMSRLVANSAHQWTSRADGKTHTGPRLRITAKADGHTVADLPLNNYLLLMKSDYHRDMSAQEYLDRAYRHNLVFFLDENNAWVRMNIVVKDWIVRIDNIDLR